ncbi:hypothetical protein LJR231_002678 [Phyllobacterium sp. LjRoot231]
MNDPACARETSFGKRTWWRARINAAEHLIRFDAALFVALTLTNLLDFIF